MYMSLSMSISLHQETRLKQELQKVRREFYQYQLKKDAELQRLLAHSKSQSQTVQALQDSLQVYRLYICFLMCIFMQICTCTHAYFIPSYFYSITEVESHLSEIEGIEKWLVMKNIKMSTLTQDCH